MALTSLDCSLVLVVCLRNGDWRRCARQRTTETKGERVLLHNKSFATHGAWTGTCVHIWQRQLMDHLRFGGVSRVLCWRRSRKRKRRRRRGTGPIPLGLSHHLLTGKTRSDTGREKWRTKIQQISQKDDEERKKEKSGGLKKIWWNWGCKFWS